MNRSTLRFVKGVMAATVLTAPVAGFCDWIPGPNVDASVTLVESVELTLSTFNSTDTPVSALIEGKTLGAVTASTNHRVTDVVWKWDDTNAKVGQAAYGYFFNVTNPDNKFEVKLTRIGGAELIVSPYDASWVKNEDNDVTNIMSNSVAVVLSKTVPAELPAGDYSATLWAGIYL